MEGGVRLDGSGERGRGRGGGGGGKRVLPVGFYGLRF